MRLHFFISFRSWSMSLFISWETQLWMKLVENGAHKNFRQLLESRWIKDQTVIGVRSVRRWLRRRIHLMCAFIFHLFSIKLIHFNWSIFVCLPAACNAVIDIAAWLRARTTSPETIVFNQRSRLCLGCKWQWNGSDWWWLSLKLWKIHDRKMVEKYEYKFYRVVIVA